MKKSFLVLFFKKRLLLLTLFFTTPVHGTDSGLFAWRQHPGATLPLSTMLGDEAGHRVTLGSLLDGLPIVLDLGYFHCPSLCGITRSDLFHAAETAGLVAGRDFAIWSVSIDPAEVPADAASAKSADLAQTPAEEPRGLHYLTGDASAVESAAGFTSRYDRRFKQFIHPAGIVVLTPSGVVSSYMLGVGYSGGDLRAAVLRAGGGGIATPVLPILLLCFHFDSTTGRYSLAIEKVLRLAAGLTVLTVLTVGGLLVMLHRRT